MITLYPSNKLAQAVARPQRRPVRRPLRTARTRVTENYAEKLRALEEQPSFHFRVDSCRQVFTAFSPTSRLFCFQQHPLISTATPRAQYRERFYRPRRSRYTDTYRELFRVARCAYKNCRFRVIFACRTITVTPVTSEL